VVTSGTTVIRILTTTGNENFLGVVVSKANVFKTCSPFR
jgi:hypothetical protein